MKKDDFKNFKPSLPKLRNSSKTEQYVYGMIYFMEGGKKPDGNTSAGITPRTLRNAQDPTKARLYVRRVVGIKHPVDLHQRLLIYRAYFDDALGDTGVKPGHLALDGIRDARTAVMVADTLFRDGSSEGAKFVHQALDDVISDIKKSSPEEASEIDQTYDNEWTINKKKGSRGRKMTMITMSVELPIERSKRWCSRDTPINSYQRSPIREGALTTTRRSRKTTLSPGG